VQPVKICENMPNSAHVNALFWSISACFKAAKQELYTSTGGKGAGLAGAGAGFLTFSVGNAVKIIGVGAAASQSPVAGSTPRLVEHMKDTSLESESVRSSLTL
jgi:hypothetical protein